MKRHLPKLAILFLLVLHLMLVLREYPLRVFLAGDVPLKGDVSRYFATAVATGETGLYGYDPHCMAGYPVGLWNSMGKKGFELLRLLLPGIGLPALFYLTLAGVSLFAPLVLWWGVKRFLEPGLQRTIFLFMVVIYWHLQTMISYFWGYGNVFFPAISCMAPVALGFAWDVVRGGAPSSPRKAGATCEGRRVEPGLSGLRLGDGIGATVRSSVLLGVVVAIIFYGHTVVLAILLVPLIVILIMGVRGGMKGRSWAGIGMALLVSLALVSWWLVPLLRNARDCVPQPHAWLQSSWRHLVMDTISDRAYRHHFDRNLLLHVAVVAGFAGVVVSWRKHGLMAVLGIGAAAGFVITYMGSYAGRFAAIQPYRFMIPSILLLILPASVGIHRAIEEIHKGNRSSRVLSLFLLLALLPQVTAYGIDISRPRLYCGLPLSCEAPLKLLNELPVKGRVLCDDTQLGHCIPYYCDLPVIGGLSAQAFLKHRFAGVDNDGRFLGRPTARWTAAVLREYLDLYAIDYAVLFRADWIRLADQNPELFVPVGEVRNHHVYRIAEAQPSFVKDGQAEVEATYDLIRLSKITSEQLVLKLHYADWLEATEGVQLDPVMLMEDPVPFIRCVVPPGVSAFEIKKRRRRDEGGEKG